MHHGSSVLPFRPWEEAPSVGWIRLNTDGAAKVGAIAGCGGVLRGNNVEWIFGFSKNIGICSAYVAELWGVLGSVRMFEAC
ncbi:histone H2A [Trifolium pratense]|uniref:Histone H2A n=1 Tax=Trifolium pratense TaxID=57577 RepID=A0A2K3MJ22_TRIPR|nr:histone H2A [Trifolium pratense]PNX90795.1 histone H2A [Trifolium pratense]